MKILKRISQQENVDGDLKPISQQENVEGKLKCIYAKENVHENINSVVFTKMIKFCKDGNESHCSATVILGIHFFSQKAVVPRKTLHPNFVGFASSTCAEDRYDSLHGQKT